MGVVGLLHDFDDEADPSPASHRMRGVAILEELGVASDTPRARSSLTPTTSMRRVRALQSAPRRSGRTVRLRDRGGPGPPVQNQDDGPARLVERKLKDKAFAQAVSRKDIVTGAAELGVPVDEHIV